ncbi:MAG: hypothetical protein GVX90_05010 [Alphaproteobacteria bacterium]|jgi:hypothetical protein|nr:hypothetical protein [Alphaproteobacteria bacterium]
MTDTRNPCIAFTLTLLAAACTSDAPGDPPLATTGKTGLEAKIANARLWPAEASVFVRGEGDPQSCLQTADTFYVVNDEDSIVFTNDGRFYLNRLQQACDDVLISGFTEAAGFGRRQVCSGMSVTLPDKFGGFPNAQCHLGPFEPLTLAAPGEAGERIVVNEGETIRRPR